MATRRRAPIEQSSAHDRAVNGAVGSPIARATAADEGPLNPGSAEHSANLKRS